MRPDAVGSLDHCIVVEETPAGLGFGEAALKLAPEFRMRRATIDGVPEQKPVVRIPIRFRLPGH
jgi:protein TonB